MARRVGESTHMDGSESQKCLEKNIEDSIGNGISEEKSEMESIQNDILCGQHSGWPRRHCVRPRPHLCSLGGILCGPDNIL